MAANSDAILTLAQMKQQLRLPATHVSDDALIQSQINQAIDHVSRDTGLPLLDQEYVVFAEIPADDDQPLVIYEQNFEFDTGNTNHEIDYWDSKADLGDAPNASIARGEIGRRIASDSGRTYFIYLDDGESWPTDVLDGSKARITGSKTFDVPAGLVPAVILLVRFLYSGNMNWPSDPAYLKFIQAYKRLVPAT